MSCPKATKGPRKRRINWLLAHPAWRVASQAPALRRHLDHHGYVTPNFSWAEMADSGGVPVPRDLRPNAIRHCWNLERFAVALAHAGWARGIRKGRVAIKIDGPYRTLAHNKAIGGAENSQHIQADATDHFATQVAQWEKATGLNRDQIISVAARYFTALGNELSDTLHFDSRPGKPGSIRFVTWGK